MYDRLPRFGFLHALCDRCLAQTCGCTSVLAMAINSEQGNTTPSIVSTFSMEHSHTNSSGHHYCAQHSGARWEETDST
eukprot:346582-Amphidinium_carterae.1